MLPIFTWAPEMPYQPEAADQALISKYGGSGTEQSASILSREFWRWPLTFLLNQSDRDAMLAFWKARRGPVGAFYWKDLTDYARAGVALTPTSDGVTLAFALPKSGEFGGDYPISNAAVRLYRAGVLNGGNLSAGTDARTIITDSAPAAGGAAMTGDYEYYRRVKFADQPWQNTLLSRAGVWRVTLGLREVQG